MEFKFSGEKIATALKKASLLKVHRYKNLGQKCMVENVGEYNRDIMKLLLDDPSYMSLWQENISADQYQKLREQLLQSNQEIHEIVYLEADVETLYNSPALNQLPVIYNQIQTELARVITQHQSEYKTILGILSQRLNYMMALLIYHRTKYEYEDVKHTYASSYEEKKTRRQFLALLEYKLKYAEAAIHITLWPDLVLQLNQLLCFYNMYIMKVLNGEVCPEFDDIFDDNTK